MLKKLLLGVAALAVVGTVAYAEDTASSGPQSDVQLSQADDNNDGAPPAPGNDGPQASNNGNGRGWWEWHRRWNGQGGGDHGGADRWGMGQGGPGHGGPRGPGMQGPGGPRMMGMMGPGNGFRLQLGKGISVGVMCGKEAIKDCVADAQPLIDAAKAAAQAQGSAAPAK